MNDSELEDFRKQLLRLQTELKGLLESSHDSTRPVELDQSMVGRLSRMDAMQGQQMAQEVARRREQQLVRIEGALRRIEAGDFGYCVACEEAINPKRLALDPTASRCLACAEQNE